MFAKYLNESCYVASDKHFFFKYFPKNAFVSEIFKILRPVLVKSIEWVRANDGSCPSNGHMYPLWANHKPLTLP